MDTYFARDISEEAKLISALLMILWVLARGFFLYTAPTTWHEKIKKSLTIALLPLCIYSFLGYSRAIESDGTYTPGGFQYIWKERTDAYDLMHYYLVPKYFLELSYFRLYPAAITADLENGGPFFKLQKSRDFIVFQDAKDYYWASSKDFFADEGWREESKTSFTPERWQEFSHDFLYLQRIAPGGLTTKTWNDMLWDHGFNGTPAWVGTMRWIINSVHVEDIKLLCYIDPLLLFISFCVTLWAFGATPALIYFIFYFTTYSSRWPTLSWAIGRYDYLSFLVIGLAFLKKERWILAGIFGSWSACIRIFPGIWFLGPFVRWATDPTIRKKLFTVFLSAGLFTLLLWANAAAQFGFDDIKLYFRKMSAHTSIKNLSSMREGFALALAYEGDTKTGRITPERRQRIEDLTPYRVTITTIVVLAFMLLVRRLPPYESYAYGFLPFFMIFTASYYYFIIRAPLFIVHACGLDSKERHRHTICLAYLFSIEVMSNYLSIHYPVLRVMQIGLLGWMLTGYVFLNLFLLARESRASLKEPLPSC